MECEDHAAYFGGMLVLHRVEVIAQGFGAGNVAVDLRLGFARDGGGFCCKLLLVLRAVFMLCCFLGGASCATQTFTFTLRPDFNR